MQKRAIDISYCQPSVNFNRVKKSGISTVIIRNGYLGKTDTSWYNNAQKAIDAGFDIGTYTYIWSDTPQKAAKEAEETIQRLERFKGKINYPVFADMEDVKYLKSRFSKNSRTEILLTFLETIDRAGYYPAVYINPDWLENHVDKTKILGKYDIWLAHYTNSPDKPTKYDYGQTMWQWGIERVKGAGEVDSDFVYVDYPAKIRDAGKNYLPRLKAVTLAFDAAVRSQPTPASKKIGLLTAGSKCVIVQGSDTYDKASNYTYVKLGGDKSQWIVKSAIEQ